MEDKILRIGESGIEAAEAKYKKLVENMVGARVPGYRAADVILRAFPSYLDAAENDKAFRGGEESQLAGSYFRKVPGVLQSTGNANDLAIEGDGFFVLQGSWGDGYTRDGRFVVDNEGRVLTLAGNYPLLGEGGPIVVVPGSTIKVDQVGQVMVNGEVIDKLRVVRFSDTTGLEFVTGSVFRGKDVGESGAEGMGTPRILQGYVETSNANIVDLMADMVQLSRIHAVNTKMIQARDQILSRAIEMGKIQ